MSKKKEFFSTSTLSNLSKIFLEFHQACEKNKKGVNGSFISTPRKGSVGSINHDSDIKKPKKKIVDPLKLDPNAPKKPIIQAYLMYYTDVRAQRQLDYPAMANKDITKIIADEWNNLPPEKKQIYDSRAQANRAQYEKELNDYLEKNPEMKAKLSQRRRKKSAQINSQSNELTGNTLVPPVQNKHNMIEIIDISSVASQADEETRGRTLSIDDETHNGKREYSSDSFDDSSDDEAAEEAKKRLKLV